jgi:uncharacterized membrane protein YgdD (TMEM256/DUF423 family)
MTHKFFLVTGAALGAISVMIGAFGAHALRKILEASGRQETFETAVKYQFYHVFALLAVGLLMLHIQDKYLQYAGLSFLAGIIIFSGSLYILCLTGVTKWGAVTPIGGTFMIIGWILMLIALARASF